MTDKVMWEKIKNVLDAEGMSYKESKLGVADCICIEFWTNTAGQDIVTEFDYDGTPQDFIKKYRDRADAYDVDEEIDVWSEIRGQRGVPSDYKTLLADMEEAKNTLMEVSKQLNQI